jgi:hypothetical protein
MVRISFLTALDNARWWNFRPHDAGTGLAPPEIVGSTKG